ncbi:Agenet domain plant type [Arabidopsis thaliana x Arabidopsis arenosa]|uniref:Agenet domain plant type n=1 Tax=Arabidopsis thaliana x Arabidopsis arenosa TaxID=1240361 RepID=A0A8T1XKD7_9BRAS|nr:Agenet domain plant type [Arabidopsis thaliana x Arabidopsis arenosa]KAG7533060.1 Agenet domain plant type [Arabidopsis thaliana x Arabidopsis arenosa]
MTQINLPFEVGQTVELRSFISGYRGAWFRCKILKISQKRRALFYDVEYLDYPGESIHTTKVFQQLEGGSEKHLMIRPVYPRQCHENEVLNKEGGGLEEAAVVHDDWKVGDLVDWWEAYCYWSGTVLEVKENGSVQIELLAPPHGEGSIYDAMSKDLRPSLEWSLEDGWTVPFSKDGEKRQCAKLMKHLNEDQVNEAESMEEEEQSGAEPRKEEKQRHTEKLKKDGALQLNIMESESVEAAVLDLEELIVRFEWMKGILAPDSSEKSSWIYEPYRPSSSRI